MELDISDISQFFVPWPTTRIALKPYRSIRGHKLDRSNMGKQVAFGFWVNVHCPALKQCFLWTDKKLRVAGSSSNLQNDRYWSVVEFL